MPGVAAPGAPASAAAIASAALKYAGAGYTYGGRADHPGDWDCSSFVSYVLGHDLGMTLPGGKRYGDPGMPPNAHGPVVVDYASWSGATTLPSGTVPQAGDLAVWPGLGPVGHVGIAVSATEMVSALDHVDGTLVSKFQGPAGATLEFRRVNGAGQLPPGVTAGATSGGSLAALLPEGVLAGLAIGGLVPLAMIGAILGGALLLGLGTAYLIAAAAGSNRDAAV